MRIRVLGCSSGACADLRTTALLVDENILVDCGAGVGDLTLEEMAAVRAGIETVAGQFNSHFLRRGEVFAP